jgi:hypothetical protein
MVDTIKNKCKGQDIKDDVSNYLKDNYGWTDSDLNKYKDEINFVARGIDPSDSDKNDFPVEDSDLNDIDGSVASVYQNKASEIEESYKNKVQTDSTNDIKNKVSASEETKNKKGLKATNVYKAKSSKPIPEPSAQAVFTSPINLPPVKYSTSISYPNSYGHVDEVMNFYKFDKLKGDFVFHHQSGNIIKMDKSGNITIHTVGNTKQIINGDFTLNVNGNMDIVVGKNFGIKVGTEMKEQIGSKKSTIASSEINLIAPTINEKGG